MSTTALAQRTDEERARGHFQAASSYFDEGEYEQAIREFQRAYDLSQRAGLLYNIALANERLGRYAEAAAMLRRYLTDEAEIPNRAALERRAQSLERRAAGGQTPEEPPVVEVEVGRPQPEPAPSGAPLPVGAIVSFSAAAAGLILYGVAGGLALDAYSVVQNDCGATMSCTEEDVSSIRTLAAVADAGLGLAIVGAALGGVLLAVELGSGSGDRQSSIRVTPTASTDGAGVLVGGAF